MVINPAQPCEGEYSFSDVSYYYSIDLFPFRSFSLMLFSFNLFSPPPSVSTTLYIVFLIFFNHHLYTLFCSHHSSQSEFEVAKLCLLFDKVAGGGLGIF